MFPEMFFGIGNVMPGINPEGDLLHLVPLEMRLRGFKVLDMKGKRPGKCVFYYDAVLDYEGIPCTYKDTGQLPELIYVLCTRRFPGEALMYNMTSVYTCTSTGVIISDSFRCDGITQCAGGDDEINCTSHYVLATDCSPFSLQMHKNSECLLCPEFYTACGNGACVPQDAVTSLKAL